MIFDWQPVILSLKVASAALVLAFVTGTPAARAMTLRNFPGKDLLEGIFLLPLVLPPVVTGYVLLMLAGRRGLLGGWLESHLHVRIIFTPFAAVLAAAIVAFPLMYGSAKAAFLGIDPHLHDAARSLGAGSWRTFTVTVPLAWPGLAVGAMLAFARAFGEFGATIMVAGNIAGQTTTVPLVIYMAAEGGDLHTAGVYALLTAVLNLGFVVAVNRWVRRRQSWAKP